jgi:hypothetical protein
MGSEMLFDPWQPHAVMLPFLLYVVLVWSVTCGDAIALPIAAFAGSLVVQTHLSYAVIVPLVGVWAVVGLAVHLRGARADASTWSDARRGVLRAVVATALVLAVCWAQPVVEQLTGDGQGNLSRLLGASRDPAAETVGLARGARTIAAVLVLPPEWLRSSIARGWQGALNALSRHPDLPSTGVAIVCLTLLAALVAICALDARRRG